MMVPVLPATLWLLAASFLILLLLVIFGYHLYQRSRLAALAEESGGIGKLAAQKERLEADAAEMRAWLASQKTELQGVDAERREQEILRADLARIERAIENRKKEGEAGLRQLADLDAMIVKKRNLLGRLDAEVKALADSKNELEPLEKSLQSLRGELEQGRLKLAMLAEQELKTASLQQTEYMLDREIAELQKNLEPLRNEKNRLRLFIEQARHASSVKNERILEQNEEIRILELRKEELRKEASGLEARTEKLREAEAEARQSLESAREAARKERDEMAAASRELEEKLADLRREEQREQSALEMLIQRREEQASDVSRLAARSEILAAEIARAQIPASRPRRQKSGQKILPLPRKSAPAKVVAQKRSKQFFCINP